MSLEHRLADAYLAMLHRVHEFIEQAQAESLPAALEGQILRAREKAVELEELSHEEAERIGDYLRRDLEDAGEYLADTSKELKDWLDFDIELVEEKLAPVFALMADHTREELANIAARAAAMTILHTGEVTGLGTLRCINCEQTMQFTKPGHIPPCPKCHGTEFQRTSQ